MKSKKLLLLMLLLSILIPIQAQTLPENKANLENELGIDLNRTYKGTEVLEIVQIILEESDAAIEESYNEGFKAATLKFVPEIESLNVQIENKNIQINNLQFKYEEERKQSMKKMISSGLTGFAIGIVSYSVLSFTIKF